jgi:tRNA A-37 threonylcarbamoyl transferase component Bud32/tetratricopeptide (TPR) repeat protein
VKSLIEALQDALGATYTIERELGGGGMARVFVATEPALGRHVVIKVLPPELTETVSADRFQREIQLAANLQHPHILPLFTAGRAGGLLYYTMPLVEGETLRGRLAREGELPASEACRILAEVARALSYAHKQGIVHRDIKPENILLSHGQAQVADFGIAKALAASAEDGNLTTRGLVLGTPAYMAPEQVTGDSSIDPRGDIYSLGVLAYEMLTGVPPFNERTPQAMMVAHAVQQPESVAARRSELPDRLAKLVMQMLEKNPSDRPQSADEVLRRLETAAFGPPATLETAALGGAVRHRRWAVAGGVVLALLAAAAWLRNRTPATTLDPKVVAVLPFRVTGADSSLGYLREGMLDLLATKLSGTRDVRTVEPRTLLSAWRGAGGSAAADVDGRSKLRVARQVGAGRLLEGEVVGPPHHVILNAKLSDAAGESEVRASVEGPVDSLTSLVDHLAAQLLILGAGEGQHRLATLTTTSLPALRAYLDGRAAHRQGDYGAARTHFDRAIELDSGFALAGIGRQMAAGWLGEGNEGPGTLLAWRYRNRLSGRDLIVLRYMLGRRYPLLTDQSDNIADAEAVVAAAPDSPEAWATLADMTYHYGPLVGMPEPLERAIQAYGRALVLDSSYAPSLEHLPEIYYEVGNTAAARQAVALRLRLDSTSFRAAHGRWFARRFLNDTVLGAISLADDSLLVEFEEVIRMAVHHGVALADAESLLALYRGRISSAVERKRFQDFSRTFHLIRGQPQRARAATEGAVMPPAQIVLQALFSDADSTEAAKLAANMPRTFSRPTPETRWQKIVEDYALAQYDLTYGKSKAARDAVRAWKNSRTAQDTALVLVLADGHALSLDAQLAARDHRRDALARVSELDSLLRAAPTYGVFLEPHGNIIAARLWHERGENGRALASIRRRVPGLGPLRPIYITYLRDEGRYAALAGDRAGAIRAYRHYLTIRSDPGPTVRPKVEEVRAELAALERETTDR